MTSRRGSPGADDSSVRPEVEADSAHRAAEFADPDEVFSQLDGAELAVGDTRWRLEIFSVVDHDGYRWIQLRATGDRHYVLTLRVAEGAAGAAAKCALAAWLAAPSNGPHVVNVATGNPRH